MSGPQKEDGYTPIANEIVEALAQIRIPGESMQVLWVILRKTYGWNKKEDRLSMNQISDLTGLKRQNVNRAIDRLITMNLLIKNNVNFINQYQFNKYYKTWKLSSKLITPELSSKLITPVIKNDDKTVIKNDDNKRKKENITKDSIRHTDFFSDFWAVYPHRNGKPLGQTKCKKYCDNFINNGQWEKLFKAVENYSKSKAVNDGYAKDPINFLVDDYWQDWIEPEKQIYDYERF